LIRRSRYLVGLCVACLCACAAVDWFYFPATTVFPDEQRYVASALRLAQTGEFWVAGDRAWEMPGTALFYAAIIRAFGAAHLVPVARAAQSVLLIVQALLVGWTTWRVFHDKWAAAIAALITAFYPFFLFYQGLLLSETLFNTLLVASFACLYWWRDCGARLDSSFLATCLCFAAATMTKATLTVFPVMLLAATAYSCLGWRRAGAVFLAASVTFAALMSPWWIRNYQLFDAFVPFSTSAAKNLYLGNNRNNPHAGVYWRTDAEPDVMARIEAIADERARQSAYSKAATDYIAAEPVAFFNRAARKFVRFWNVVPNAEAYSGNVYRIISALSFGPVLLLAAFCALLWRRTARALLPIYLLIGYFTLVHMVTIASLRYRLPIEPFLIVMAASTLGRLMTRYCENSATDDPHAFFKSG